jgi:hypothetical protein
MFSVGRIAIRERRPFFHRRYARELVCIPFLPPCASRVIDQHDAIVYRGMVKRTGCRTGHTIPAIATGIMLAVTAIAMVLRQMSMSNENSPRRKM